MRRRFLLAISILLALSFPTCVLSQATDGNLVGTVLDATEAAIPGASLALENLGTGVKHSAETDAAGQFRFNNAPAGLYRITARADGFTDAVAQNVSVELNKTATVNLRMQLATVTTTVDVVDAPALIDTTTAQIGATYQSRQTLDLPATGFALGVLNLSLVSAGVASSGGVGAGEGPSVGGLRPRQNNFTIDGVDNNRKNSTDHNVDVPNEAVAQFTILQNQFSAEFGHSAGGQFNTIVKSGANELHGAIYEYFQNRKLNAVDEVFARQGVRENPRYDQNRLGGVLGGPIRKNRLFYFGSFEYNPTGRASTPSSAVLSPTADGYTRLSGVSGLSQTNLDVLRRFLSPAPQATAATRVRGVEIPIGIVPIVAPSYENRYYWLVSVDYSLSNRDQLRARYIDNRVTAIDAAANLPVFYDTFRVGGKLFTLSEFHSFAANLNNELRLNYSRNREDLPAGTQQFPGLDAFPNVRIRDDLNLQLGPNESAPQSRVLNTYQLVENLTWTRDRHTLKFGIDTRKYIFPNRFIQRERGDYQYTTLERFLLDLSPNIRAERSVGLAQYWGNSADIYWYVNDDFRIRRNLTLNLGVRQEYKGVAAGDKLHRLNSVSNVPGLIEFREPQAEKNNFAPRVGLAYSPGSSGNTSIRAGFGMGYDVFFDNIGGNNPPPQLRNTVILDPNRETPNFLRDGGIRSDTRPAELTAAQARQRTSAWFPDRLLTPYSIQWTLSVQQVLARDYTVEVRYLGTRGVHMINQTWINFLSRATAARHLPTLFQRPSQADLDRLTPTLNDLQALSFFKPEFERAGFGSVITAFLPRGNSVYHGLAAELTRRLARGFLFKAAYTWSHNIDDSTAELNSTQLAPRRPQDFDDMRSERATSLLDRRHRFTYSWVWDAPWFQKDPNWARRSLVGNWTFSGAYIAESPSYATVQSGLDSNLNADSVGDRVIINPNGVEGTGSGVTALTNGAGRTVAYLVNNPNAQYIVAGAGAYANGGRNTLPLRGINNFDLGFIKRLAVREGRRLEFRASFFNFFNHPQYVPGSVSTVKQVLRTGTQTHLIPSNPRFNRPDLVYESNPRNVTLGLRFAF